MSATKFKVGQVVWDKSDGAYVKIVQISKFGGLLKLERFGNFWTALPNTVRPLTKRERGAALAHPSSRDTEGESARQPRDGQHDS